MLALYNNMLNLRLVIKPRVDIRFLVTTLILISMLAGCTPMIYPPGASENAGQIRDHQFITDDGAALPLKSWLPSDQQTIKAIIIALHGFNDYSNFFQQPGNYFKLQNIACYAYDQRGFGRGLVPISKICNYLYN